MSSIYDWKLDAPSNANSDSLINWQEGQPPSSVNNSARAMMQRVAEYLADKTAITASGNQQDIVGTIKSPITKLISGLSIKLIAIAPNAPNATLNINNTGQKPIFKHGETSVVRLQGGEMVTSGVYNLTYIDALNGNTGGWFLDSPSSQPKYIPSGVICAFAQIELPDGWIDCDGRAISRSQYASLFATIGVRWGAGNGETTFNVPDLRGEFIRVWDEGRGVDRGRGHGEWQDSMNRSHSHSGTTTVEGIHDHDYSQGYRAHYGMEWGSTYTLDGVRNQKTSASGGHQHGLRIDNSGGDEARPRNIALKHGIKA